MRYWTLAGVILFVALSAGCGSDDGPQRYEVWVLEQSDTAADGGGTLHIYQDDSLMSLGAGAVAEKIDLGGAVRDMAIAQTGTAPRRPHMLFFNAPHTHAVIAFVATGHVLFMDASRRTPVGIVDVGVQAHAAVPSPDQSIVVVADQNGKKLHRIRTDYQANSFTIEPAAMLDLAVGTTPSGALRQDPVLRPDNAPICIAVDSTSRFGFITLRGGGLLVVDVKATPMAIVAEYDAATVHPNGCGGVETAGRMYINAGGGTAANPLESDLYSFNLSAFSTTPQPVNTPAPNLVFSHDARGTVDSHGTALVSGGRYLWAADRAANLMVVVDTATNTVVNEFSAVGAMTADPAPDLMAASPRRDLVFATLRGPTPLTGNAPGVNNAVGATPGLGMFRIEQDGRHGVLQAVAPISHIVNNVEVSDPHGIGMRMRH